MTKKQYTVVFERGDRPNQWLASIRELPECHTFGRGLAQTRARIREALALWEGDGAADAELAEVLPLPDAVRRVKRKLDELQEKLDQALQERDEVVASLREHEWSVRDIAEVFSLSYQRIGQVAPARRRRAPRNGTSSR